MAYVSSGIWSLVPDTCASRVDPSTATDEESEQFYNRWSNFVASLMVDSTVGIVLGSISAAGCALFCLWFCVVWQRRKIMQRAQRAKREKRAEDKQAQFMAADEFGAPSPGAAPEAQQQTLWQRVWQRLTAGKVLKWAVVVMATAVVGVSAWGLAESIIATNDLISDFWLLVDGVYDLAFDLTVSLQQLGVSLGATAGTLGDVKGALQTIIKAVDGIPVVGGILGKALPMDKIRGFFDNGGADIAIGTLNNASALILNDVVPLLNDTVLPQIDAARESNESWSLDIQDKWRYIVIAVLFGLLILLAIAVAAACWRMHWRLTATFLVALLWALNAAVMFLGMGMLNGAKGVAHDACLYGEDAVGRLVNTTVTGSASEKVTAALQYYSGQANLVDSKGNALLPNATDECNPELTAALLRQIAGIDIHSTLVTVWDLADSIPDIAKLLNGINLPSIPLVNFDLDTVKEPVATAAGNLQGLLKDVCNTTLLLVRENRVWPLYVEIKTYICCDLTNSVYDVWLPWVIAGSLALALSFLASARVVAATLAPGGRGGGGREAADDGEAVTTAAAIDSVTGSKAAPA